MGSPVCLPGRRAALLRRPHGALLHVPGCVEKALARGDISESHPPESNRRPTDYERKQEVAERVRRVDVSRQNGELRVVAEPSAGTGSYGHGDWMETDR